MKQNKDDKIRESLREKSIEETLPFKYSITSYGVDYPVDSLTKRLNEGSIYIPPFQRGFVWDLSKASRFIESLLLGLPVPGIFLSRDEETQKLLVIDGQQRLMTLRYFYDGIFHDTGRQFALTGVESKYKGVTYKSLSEEDRRRLNDSIIHATIVKQDEPSEDASSVFHIFERLNTGGSQLHPQEIRTAMYQGEFNDLIEQLNRNESWRDLFGPVSSRMRDRELILRFLALYFNGDKYERPMKEFLNSYMSHNRHFQMQSADQIWNSFVGTVEIIGEYLGSKAFRRKGGLIAAIYDAVMVGAARRLERGGIHNLEGLKKRYQELMANDQFIEATLTHTTDEENVQTRLRLAVHAFADIE